MWPPAPDLLALWERLRLDPTTAGAFASAVLIPLAAELRRAFPFAHADDVEGAVHDAVLWAIEYPDRFDPEKSPPDRFLRLVAERALTRHLRRESKRRDGRKPLECVGLDPADDNLPQAYYDLSEDRARLAPLLADLDPVDRRVWDLLCDGERRTLAFAGVLGIADRPADQQTAEVKRAKDRIKARLKRGLEPEPE